MELGLSYLPILCMPVWTVLSWSNEIQLVKIRTSNAQSLLWGIHMIIESNIECGSIEHVDDFWKH